MHLALALALALALPLALALALAIARQPVRLDVALQIRLLALPFARPGEGARVFVRTALPGLLAANLATLPASLAAGTRTAATTVLWAGVVLLGRSVSGEAVPSVGWPVLLLVLAAVAATLVRVVLDLAAPARTALLAVAMVGLAAAVLLRDLRRLGLRPLVLGLVSWVLLGGGTVLGLQSLVG